MTNKTLQSVNTNYLSFFLFFLNTGNHVLEECWYLHSAATACVDGNARLLQPRLILCVVRAVVVGSEGDLHQTLHLFAGEQRETPALSAWSQAHDLGNCL